MISMYHLLLAAMAAAEPTPSPAPATEPVVAPTQSPTPTAEASPAPAPEVGPPTEFGAEAQALFSIVICGGGPAWPPELDQAALKSHCATIDGLVQTYKTGWLAKAAPFLAGLRPPDLPRTVVYPFGGGDLLGALATFPVGDEYTLMSIEASADPRALVGVDKAKFAQSLDRVRRNIGNQVKVAHNLTKAMARASRDLLPTQLVYALFALRAHGQRPVGLRYFQINPDGTLHYFAASELPPPDAPDPPADADPCASPFSSMELTFVPQDAAADAPVRVMRHVCANLDNVHLEANTGVLKHLEAKGKVAAMTKAASYLLWGTRFTAIRSYLLAHMTWMVSDSTGIDAATARQSGFESETYGRFEGPFLDNASQRVGREMVAYWKASPYRYVPMAYGYPDSNHHWHLLVTKPMPTPPAVAPSVPPAREALSP
jgi:hypothetical protein